MDHNVKPQGCCADFLQLDLSKMKLPGVVWSDPNLLFCVSIAILPPLFWNIVARYEYRTQFLTNLFCGQAKLACISLAVCIISLTITKTYRFTSVMDSQPKCTFLQNNWALGTGYICIYAGLTLVVSSFYVLGFFGTYLGDYFGILMDKKVTGFPFNVVDNPMYVGTTMNYMGMALVNGSFVGIYIAMIIAMVYYVAIQFEGPFTEEIYRSKMKKDT